MATDPPVKFRRRKKLIDPGLQLGLVCSFGGVALLAMLLQFLCMGYFMIQEARELDGGGGELAAQVPGALLTVFGLTFVVLLPIFLAIGVLLTFRIAGPAYRFEQHLRAIARGENPGPCRIRNGDKLQSLCDAINLATEHLRGKRAA